MQKQLFTVEHIKDVPPTSTNQEWQIRIHVSPIDVSRAVGILRDDIFPDFKDQIPIVRWKYADFEAIETDPRDKEKVNDLLDGAYNGADRDQRGKTICIYLQNPNVEGEHAEQYKEFMLAAWKALQDADVRLSYQTPSGDKAIPVGASMPSPFSYASLRDWSSEHGILHEVSHNPGIMYDDLGQAEKNEAGNPDPLSGVGFSTDDLDENEIQYNKSEAKGEIFGTISDMKEHFKDTRHALFDDHQSILRIKENLNTVLENATFENAAEMSEILDKRYPKKFNDKHQLADEVDELKHLVREGELEENRFKEIIGGLQGKLQNQVDRINEQFTLSDVENYEETYGKNGIFSMEAGELARAIENNPAQMQKIYRRQVHMDHEQKQIDKLTLFTLSRNIDDITNKLPETDEASELESSIAAFKELYFAELDRLGSEGKSIKDIAEDDVMQTTVAELDTLISTITDDDAAEDEKVNAIRHFESQMKRSSWKLFKNAFKAIIIAAAKFVARKDITHEKSEIHRFFKTKDLRRAYRPIAEAAKEGEIKKDDSSDEELDSSGSSLK